MNLNYNKVKYLFYPLTKETIFFAEYFFKVQARAENEVTFIAPKGAALAEKNFYYAFNQESPLDIIILDTNYLQSQLLACDVLFIPPLDSKIDSLLYSSIESVIEFATQNQKAVIHSSQNNYNIVQDSFFEITNNKIPFQKCLNNFTVPIIGIGGLFDFCHTLNEKTFFDIIYTLRSQNFRVTAFGLNPADISLGIHPLPFDEARLKFNNCVDEIYFLNNFVYQYAHIEKADFVIIQFPSGLLKYSNRHVNEFGINAYKLSNALPINYFICTTALNYAHPSFISEINTIFRYRYDFEVSAVCITNLLYQGYNLDEKAPSILQIAPSQMQSTINEYPASNDFFIYNLFDENSISKLLNLIL